MTVLADPAAGAAGGTHALNDSEEGQAFRRAREAHGLTLDAVAEDLLVRDDLLEALERGEIDQVARPAIAQAHRRLYARYLGFDAKSIRGGGPLGVPAADCKAAKLAARLRGAPPGDAPGPPPDAEPPSQADVFAGAEAGASEPEPPPERPPTASPPPQPWWFRRSVMVAAVAVFCVGLLVSIVLALAAGYGQAG